MSYDYNNVGTGPTFMKTFTAETNFGSLMLAVCCLIMLLRSNQTYSRVEDVVLANIS